ncbi:hypothetical protein EVA_04061 [gut metagenome]|uniref:Uncharacterized protein n=1 Tax=gut metagenome TaxID=749906 RepID=J9GKG6_9ZZZZ
MGATAELSRNEREILSGMDSIVIRNYMAGLIGGCTLDMSTFKQSVIKAGHIVIRDTASGTYKPMPVNSAGKAYDTLPGSHEYVGVVVCSKPADEPFVGVMYAGEVNDIASPYPIDAIKDELKKQLPMLVFKHD